MMPAAPTTAFKIGEKTVNPLTMYVTDLYTIPANLAGLPGLSVPCGFDPQGMPIGLQILGPAFSEDRLLKIGNMFQSQTNWHTKKPEL
jgi:aspartyl-tRNA(Asn)/glutamyl-tRNA(Gln) amidotransferase subunit A